MSQDKPWILLLALAYSTTRPCCCHQQLLSFPLPSYRSPLIAAIVCGFKQFQREQTSLPSYRIVCGLISFRLVTLSDLKDLGCSTAEENLSNFTDAYLQILQRASATEGVKLKYCPEKCLKSEYQRCQLKQF